ncbi:MAG: transposase [Synergistaceae bacterium]
MQIWYKLSDEGVEEGIYDSYAMRKFMKIGFTNEQVPDATTLLKFRRIIEKQGIGKKIFTFVKEELDASGLLMHGGTI